MLNYQRVFLARHISIKMAMEPIWKTWSSYMPQSKHGMGTVVSTSHKKGIPHIMGTFKKNPYENGLIFGDYICVSISLLFVYDIHSYWMIHFTIICISSNESEQIGDLSNKKNPFLNISLKKITNTPWSVKSN